MRYSQLLVLLLARAHVDCTSTVKCRDGTERKEYQCYVDYNTQETWCDDSNFTRIPRPTDIVAFMDPAESIRLFFNSTCLDDLRGDLAPYNRLQMVNLDGNMLNRINDIAFSKCSTLTTLILSRNQITDISDNAFAGLTQLETLSLSGNRLTKISDKIFSKLHNLKVLSLSYNRIELIETNAFCNLSKLESLDLSGNKLARIEWGYRTVFQNLKSLNLQDNELTSFNAKELRVFTKLTHLNLKGNNITCITGSDNFKLRSLVSVQLSDNRLENLAADWFRSVWSNGRKPAVKSYVSGNRWECDCSAYNYWRMLTIEIWSTEWRKALTVTCHSPETVRGLHLHTIDKSYFDSCESKEEVKNCSNPPSDVPASSSSPTTTITSSKASSSTVGVRVKVKSTTHASTSSQNAEIDRKKSDIVAIVGGIGQKPDDVNTKSEVPLTMILGFVLALVFLFLVGFMLCKVRCTWQNGKESRPSKVEKGMTNRDDDVDESSNTVPKTPQVVSGDINLISQPCNNVYHDVESKAGSQTRRSRYDSGLSSINPEEDIAFLEAQHFSLSSDKDNTVPKALHETEEPNVAYIPHPLSSVALNGCGKRIQTVPSIMFLPVTTYQQCVSKQQQHPPMATVS